MRNNRNRACCPTRDPGEAVSPDSAPRRGPGRPQPARLREQLTQGIARSKRMPLPSDGHRWHLCTAWKKEDVGLSPGESLSTSLGLWSLLVAFPGSFLSPKIWARTGGGSRAGLFFFFFFCLLLVASGKGFVQEVEIN